MIKYEIKIKSSKGMNTIFADSQKSLRQSLIESGIISDYPCGGKGICKKCKAKVLGDGECEILLCKTYPECNMEIELLSEYSINVESFEKTQDDIIICYDIGTTTLEFSVIDTKGKRVCLANKLNPQIVYGADVLSRIESCREFTVKKVQEPIVSSLKEFVNFFFEKNGIVCIKKIYVCANTVLTHIFAGISPESMSKYPYVTVFNGTKTFLGKDFDLPVEEIVLLPAHSAFFGSDALVGLCNTDAFDFQKPILYLDIGTNGEIALVCGNKIYLTATSAGPCFEGVNISCGMGGVNGAIVSVFEENGEVYCTTIGNTKPLGLCGAGLISALSFAKDKHYVDKSGKVLKSDKLNVVDGVSLTQNDINQFLLAKSAIRTAIEVLLSTARISADSIEKVYIAGNLGKFVEIYSMINCGILPAEFKNKCVKVGKNAIFGTEEYAREEKFAEKVKKVKEKAEWIDLSLNQEFSYKFCQNLNFD